MFEIRDFMKKILTILLVLLISQTVINQTKIDEYGRLIADDESGRLVSVAVGFSENSDLKVYFLHTKEKKTPLGRFLRHINGVARYLTLYKVPKESIFTDARKEERDSPQTEIWLIKKNEELPLVNKTPLDEKLREQISKKTLFDEECTDCSPAVDLDQGIFQEGLDYLSIALKANPTSKAILKIQRVEFLSETLKQRQELTNQIIKRLKNNKIQRSRFSIHFPSRINRTRFYIIPNLKQR
jgi:hypothetical protein